MLNNQLQKYINVVTWDLQKMYKIAEDAQKEFDKVYSSPIPTTPIATPSIIGTTINHQDHRRTFHDIHQPEYARCAIPIAMVLTSSIDFIGALLSPRNLFGSGNKFDAAIKNFFQYLENNGGGFGEILHDKTGKNERNLLVTIFRNGLMHDFFPKGVDVAINYDTKYANKKLFFPESGYVILNVYKLRLIVEWVLNRINKDETSAANISSRLADYEGALDDIKDIIGTYKTKNSAETG